MFKFKKGDKVYIKPTELFSTTFGGCVTMGPGHGICSEITDCKTHMGENQYRVKSFTGWWCEDALELA